jgi:DNA adenine methylase
MSEQMRTLFRYYGGKFHLLNDIYNIIEPLYNNKKIVSVIDVFGGSGKVLLNISEHWKVNRVYNDIDHRLFILLNVLRDDNKREILFERLNYTLSSRELFNKIKNEKPENDIDIAFNTLYLIFYSYNVDMKTYGLLVNAYKDLNTQKENIFNNYQYTKDWRIENLDFRELIKRYDGQYTFFYLDPPYITSGNRYEYSFTLNDFKDLKNILDNVNGYWLMNESERDFEKIKEIFGEPKTTKKYATSIHHNRGSKKHSSYRLEGFWANFDIDFKKYPEYAINLEERNVTVAKKWF